MSSLKRKVYDKEGNVAGEIELPKVFQETVRPDLIKRAVLSDMSKEYQPKGNYVWAGLETSAKYRGRKESYASLKNRGQAKLPRTVRPKGRMGEVRKIPSAVKGRRAHPPKVEKVIVEKMNKKEYLKALMSAIAATSRIEFVTGPGRNHKVSVDVPIILSDDVETLSKTKDVHALLRKIVEEDLLRAKKGRVKRTTRLGGYKEPKSVLIVVKDKNSKLLKSARNIPGVDVVDVASLKVSMLAPGTFPGRLTAYTEGALKELDRLEEIVLHKNN